MREKHSYNQATNIETSITKITYTQNNETIATASYSNIKYQFQSHKSPLEPSTTKVDQIWSKPTYSKTKTITTHPYQIYTKLEPSNKLYRKLSVHRILFPWKRKLKKNPPQARFPLLRLFEPDPSTVNSLNTPPYLPLTPFLLDISSDLFGSRSAVGLHLDYLLPSHF